MKPHHRLRPPLRARGTSTARKLADVEAQVGFGNLLRQGDFAAGSEADPQGEVLHGEVQIDSFWSKFAANQPRKRDFDAGTLYVSSRI